MATHGIHRLINKHGSTLTLIKRTTSGTYNPSTGSISGSADTSTNIVGYFYTNKQGGFEEVATGKRMIAISGKADVTPSKGDYITGFGDKVRIGSVHPILDKGQVIVYQCEVEE